MNKIESTISNDNSRISWKEFLLMFFVLSLSGNPYIHGEKLGLFLLVSFIIPLVHIGKNYKKSVSYRTILIFAFLLGYELMHAFIFNLDYSFTIFKVFLILILASTTADILKARFIPVLTKTMVYLSIISFVFVILCYIPGINKFLFNFADNLFPLTKDWKGHSAPTLLIYTFHPEFFMGVFSYVRNASIFWESGAFAVFLNITLFLHYSSRTVKRFKDLFDKDATILIIAVLSTASTMALIALLTVLIFFSSQLKTVMKYILIVFISLASYLAFTSIEFMGNKVRRQLAESGTSNNRFGSAIKDFQDFSRRPLFGWSRRNEVLFGTTEFTAKTHRPNGLSNLLRSYGSVYFIFYFFMLFTSFQMIFKYHHHTTNFIMPAFGILLLFIVSFSEPIFDLLFLKVLMFLYHSYYYTSQDSINKSEGAGSNSISHSFAIFRERFIY